MPQKKEARPLKSYLYYVPTNKCQQMVPTYQQMSLLFTDDEISLTVFLIVVDLTFYLRGTGSIPDLNIRM
jgi:hypothetical protein